MDPFDEAKDLEARREVMRLLQRSQRAGVLSLLQTAQIALMGAGDIPGITVTVYKRIREAHIALGEAIVEAERVLPKGES